MTGRRKNLFTALFLLYLAALLTITVVRPWRAGYRFLGGSFNTKLLVGYLPILRTSPPYFLYLFGGNIAWFVPLGFWPVFVKRRPIARVVLYGFLLSLFIETMQFVLGTGVSEIDDLLLNTLGSAVGGLAASYVLHTRLSDQKASEEERIT